MAWLRIFVSSWLHVRRMTSVQLVVVGGGPGGYAAAFLGADLGLSVALVDPEANPGGVCVYRRCDTPTARLHVANVIDQPGPANARGEEVGKPNRDKSEGRA